MSILRGSVTDIDKMFRDNGWRKAGGTWGNAQWKMFQSDLYAITGRSLGLPLRAPRYGSAPALVTLYDRQNLDPIWTINWELGSTTFELPTQADDTMEWDVFTSYHLFPNLKQALDFVQCSTNTPILE